MRRFAIKLGNLIMRTRTVIVPALIVSLATLATPALAQPAACVGLEPGTAKHIAKREFVESFQAANAALAARDYAGAIAFADLARPHAVSGQQTSAATQVEIAALNGLNSPNLRPKITAALTDPCLPDAVRENYLKMLAQ